MSPTDMLRSTGRETTARLVDVVERPRWSAGRLVFLAVTGLCLYFLAPSLAEVFAAWRGLRLLDLTSVVLILACGAMTFVCMWYVQAIVLDTRDWFVVVTTQLAGNAFNRITPGGGATGTALSARMLGNAGFDTATAATGLTVQSLLSTATLVAIPIFSVPAIIAGTQVPPRLVYAAWIGVAVFVFMTAIGLVLFATDRPVVLLGRAIDRVLVLLRRRSESTDSLGARLLGARNEIRETIGARWPHAIGGSVARWGFEYGVLVLALRAIHAHIDPWLVLLAFVGASMLGLLPFTPGGLGFVEAGLTGTLALAGVATDKAVLATLVYRLVTFWLPLPIGFVAAIMFRGRYPRPARVRQSATSADGET